MGQIPHRVGLHNGCESLRRRKHANSELHEPIFSKPMDLLSKVAGIQFVAPSRPDECCGFGRSLMLVTALSPVIGYDRASAIAHAANDRDLTLRQAALESGAIDATRFDQIVDPAKLVGQGVGGS